MPNMKVRYREDGGVDIPHVYSLAPEDVVDLLTLAHLYGSPHITGKHRINAWLRVGLSLLFSEGLLHFRARMESGEIPYSEWAPAMGDVLEELKGFQKWERVVGRLEEMLAYRNFLKASSPQGKEGDEDEVELD